MSGWLRVRRGQAPLILSLPHTGTEIPQEIERQLRDPWLARKDADWWIDRLYDFADELDATVIHTSISRTVIDVNRDPSGASLYPGQSTTALCPATTFDGEPLYRDAEPAEAEIAERREQFFAPYHAALATEIERLRQAHERIVLYDCHSIRSRIARLFDGLLPAMNIGTNSGASCDPVLTQTIERIAAASPFDRIVNGRFKGGWITRTYGKPDRGVHAVQMELACRTYMQEPDGAVDASNWPGRYDAAFAAPMRETLRPILIACSEFALSKGLHEQEFLKVNP